MFEKVGSTAKCVSGRWLRAELDDLDKGHLAGLGGVYVDAAERIEWYETYEAVLSGDCCMSILI